MALKERVIVEEQNLQDYQRRKEEEKGRNGKLHMKNLLGKRPMWLERRPVDGLGMGREGKAMQRYGRLSLPDIL